MNIVIAVLAGLIAAGVGWPFVAGVLKLAAKRDGAGGRSPWNSGHGEVAEAPLLRGGLWIGLLERAIVAAGLVLGHPGIMAVVVAIKGLGRIPEIRASSAAGEKFIIGTFASLGFAGAVGALGIWLVTAWI